jgi:hypothetical protein
MIGFFKKLLYGSVEPIRVEVTINVPEIKVFISGGLQGEAVSDSGSRARAYEGGCAEVDESRSVDYKLEELGKKYSGKTVLPEVSFGQEAEIEEEKD